jgi:hypothetical protein
MCVCEWTCDGWEMGGWDRGGRWTDVDVDVLDDGRKKGCVGGFEGKCGCVMRKRYAKERKKNGRL